MATVPGSQRAQNEDHGNGSVWQKELAWQLPLASAAEKAVCLGGKPGFSGEKLGVSGALLTMEWDSWGHRGKT